ncbi:MAG TPA: malonyl-CoA decarboxylase family protein [Novosphingobium sp.]|nr:malonyl-CoA decarboxylase family protein [Novosphingobium sp.]
MVKPAAKAPAAKPAAPRAARRSPLDMVMASRLGKLLGRIGVAPRPASGEGLLDLAGALLSLRGKASGPALASAFFDLYEASDLVSRQAFLGQIHALHPHDSEAINKAVARWVEQRDEASARALHDATQSPSQRLIDMLNLAPGGTRRLLAMREDLLAAKPQTPGLKALDVAFADAFEAWFNAGFLELRPIAWESPAALLERIIKYEAVHQIQGWDDLRRRLEPADRRCYGFFHPQMADDPLIFVEVALTAEIPGAIGQVITDKRKVLDPRETKCAIFYSISNCQDGLRGIPFGNYLIKRVVGLLRDELPPLDTFATRSPVPGLTAHYLGTGRNPRGQVLDPVARFPLGNGARLEAIHADADLSANGKRQSHGIMVNYVYDLAEIEANHFALAELGQVACSKPVAALAESGAKVMDGPPKQAA